MVSLVFGIIRAKTFLGFVFLNTLAWWSRKLGKIDAKIEYVARPVILPKKKR